MVDSYKNHIFVGRLFTNNQNLLYMDELLTNIYFWLVIVVIIGFIIYPYLNKEKDISGNNKMDMDSLRIMREEKERKEAIVKRVYSYKYENVIYEIFSPYARKGGGGSFRRQIWTIDLVYIEDEFVKNEISRILNIPYSDAAKLFEEFLDNQLLTHSFGQAKCSVGNILTEQWDIITKRDNNFSIWMDSHPNVESKNSVDKRREKYSLIKTIPFLEFINIHGKYSIENPLIKSYDTYFLMFDDGTRVCAYLPDLEIDNKNEYNKKVYLSHDYLLNEIQSMSDLYVRIDDNHYNLIKKQKE